MFCSNCGAKLDDNAKFCSNCGNRSSGNVKSNMLIIADDNNKYYNLDEKRNFLNYLLTFIISVGIYQFFFWPKYIKDLNIACDDNNNSPGYFTVFFLSLFTIGIYYYFWSYKQLNRISILRKKLGLEEKITPSQILSIGIIGYFFGFGILALDFFLVENLTEAVKKLKNID